MPRPSKNLTERVAELEKKFSELDAKCASIDYELFEQEMRTAHVTATIPGMEKEPRLETSADTQAPVELPSVGRVGPTVPEEVPSFDEFLFSLGPQIIDKLSQADSATAVTVTDWLIGDEKIKEFFIIWFASDVEIRKYLIFTIILRNMVVSQARFELLKNTIPPAAIEEIKEAYHSVVQESNPSGAALS